MNYLNAVIDDMKVSVPEGTTIMEAGDSIGAHVPRLCYHPFLSTEGACRICIVEIDGWRNFVPACATKVQEGMKIKNKLTGTSPGKQDVTWSSYLLDNHPNTCQTCERDGNCELTEPCVQARCSRVPIPG
jgi:NADP-reducing hydrogenase subunit HndD